MSRARSGTAASVARWLVRRFEDGGGYLEREDAVCAVDATFGPPFSQTNERGHLSIAPEVLAAFRKLTPDAVWDHVDRAWRRRDDGDDPDNRRT